MNKRKTAKILLNWMFSKISINKHHRRSLVKNNLEKVIGLAQDVKTIITPSEMFAINVVWLKQKAITWQFSINIKLGLILQSQNRMMMKNPLKKPRKYWIKHHLFSHKLQNLSSLPTWRWINECKIKIIEHMKIN